ncbi:MAG TPA: glycoside hydrolase family 127 protein [Anaerohalosphaeraceae bacterium]|nr:glycoside hydrolase family 127 protein [Anaerohalosphaeraceae bacterium]
MKTYILICLLTVLSACSWAVVAESTQPKIKIAPRTPIEAYAFNLHDVRLLDGPFRAAMERDAIYLLTLEPDRLLAWFRKEAGLEPKGEVYGGWESQGVAGHCLGHYLSACALMYASSNDERFKERAAYIVDEMALCQDKNGNGYVAAIPGGKKCFEEIARGDVRSQGFDLNGLWVPWYTIHKEMAGLRDVYLLCDNAKALEVWIKFTDWAYTVTDKLTEAQWQTMLACEQGGMKETCADLYSITGDEKYLTLAERFTHKFIMDPLSRKEDRLAGIHANTQVPKVIGAARQYELTGSDYYKTIAEYFWDRVVHYHSYVNGGNSADEHFGQPGKLNDRMHDTTETCNTYNMLKLTMHLFSWQPTAALGDYYERALYNHILAHQHPMTGMFKYKGFLDMPARKNFSDPFNSFWCCVGTGMENHVKYGESIYYHKGDTLYVNLFIASELNWQDKGLKVKQETGFPYSDTVKLTFSGDKAAKAAVLIRKPYWTEGMTVTVNGKAVDAQVNAAGFVAVERDYADGDVIELRLPMKLHIQSMPDNPNRIAFLYGPTLLCADLNGNQPTPALLGTYEDLLKACEPVAGRKMEFEAKGIARVLGADGWNAADIRLVPHFEVADQLYTVYMDIFTPQQWEAKQKEYQEQLRLQKELEARTVDVLLIGQMQPERDHNLDGDKTGIGEHLGRKWRHATDGGWFAFDMKVVQDTPLVLSVTYWGGDSGRTFDILMDDVKLTTQKLNNNKPGQFMDVQYDIPAEMVKGKDKIRIKFAAHPGNFAGGIFDCRILKK